MILENINNNVGELVVDRLSKYAHFIALAHPYTAASVAQVFLDNIYRLHGLPNTIVSDRDKKFLKKPKQWAKWLPLAEWWYTNHHSATNTTPYEAMYGQSPPLHIPYVGGENKGRTDRQFTVGDWVYLKLQPHRQVTMRGSKQNKFSPKYYGPFQVLKKIGQVAYELQLPAQAQIHNVFHVSQLKKCRGTMTIVGDLPAINNEGVIAVEPIAILERRLAKKGNAATVYVLVQWANGSAEDATWESIEEIQRRFPTFAC
ncbi:retrotransposable element Tf2 [Tanacetum coccineum]